MCPQLFGLSPVIRGKKPRTSGLTSIIDRGIPVSELRGLMENAGEYIDLCKFGWCTWLLMPERLVKSKIEVCEEFDVKVLPGGSSIEAAFIRGKAEEFLRFVKELGFTSIEISSGIANISIEEKLRLVRLAKDLDFCPVITEVGRKDPKEDLALPLNERIRLMKLELEAGADYVVVEARESGKGIGPYNAKGDVKESFVEAIVRDVPVEKIIWEAPLKSQQVWLIKRFGPNVNLGNVQVGDVIPLETLRLGLRGDTMLKFLLS
ncbi:MAG: phosphosulfolactate synthase [Candidatus Freyarchaeota archaeon]|nr:phosphosulfolactate synthase [Candidatus Freyrarchaeum guaymaensis]